mmetsp:Transcript_13954/g.21030  ORF Transcript_13954/g.21030 Transcript_13954/m.21030 type:complete len:129 (-) Transcript_13954:510-896(-)
MSVIASNFSPIGDKVGSLVVGVELTGDIVRNAGLEVGLLTGDTVGSLVFRVELVGEIVGGTALKVELSTATVEIVDSVVFNVKLVGEIVRGPELEVELLAGERVGSPFTPPLTPLTNPASSLLVLGLL